MKDRSCCFTEHRPNSLPFGYNEHEESCVKLKAILTDTIEKQITENGVTHFISGMAMGVDMTSCLQDTTPGLNISALSKSKRLRYARNFCPSSWQSISEWSLTGTIPMPNTVRPRY